MDQSKKATIVESPKGGFDVVCDDYYLDKKCDIWYPFIEVFKNERGVFSTKEKAEEILKSAPPITKKHKYNN